MPTLSIIIPVYNVQKYLPGCLASIVTQEYSDYEIILVDDGSTDESPRICDSFVLENTNSLVIHQSHLGVGEARNIGIERATGTYLLFIDSDDSINQGALKQMMHIVAETKADILTFGYQRISIQGDVIGQYRGTLCEDKPLDIKSNPELLQGVLAVWSKVIRKSLFINHQIRFPKDIWYEDFPVTTSLYAVSQNIWASNECYYRYLIRPGSIMHGSNIERNLEIIDALNYVGDYFDKNNLSAHYQQELEYLATYHGLLLASVRILRLGRGHEELLERIYRYVAGKFPTFHKNTLLHSLSKREKILLYFLRKHWYTQLHTLFFVSERLRGRK